MNRESLRLVVLSDTHGLHGRLDIPDGDVLIHAGDFCLFGEEGQLPAFADFLAALPHRHKLLVAGNHDFVCQRDPAATRVALGDTRYLQDEAVEIGGWRFYGSPWQPWFMDMAFNVRSDAERAAIWARVPPDTDVLVTHSPPRGRGDLTSQGERVGCAELAARVAEVRPRVHIFGHIHEGYGTEQVGDTLFANGSNCTLDYRPDQPPLVIDLEE